MPYKFQIIMIAALCISATATSQDTTSAAGEIVQTKSGPVKVERLARLSEPWGMTFLADGCSFTLPVYQRRNGSAVVDIFRIKDG